MERRLRLQRCASFGFGLFTLASGVSLILGAHLGAAPFDALVTGVAKELGISVGSGYWVVGAAFSALAWALGKRPRPGTLVCVVVLGWLVNVLLPEIVWVAHGTAWPARVLVAGMGEGLLVMGASAIVLADFGAGLVEEVMLALTRHHIGVREARWGLEAACLGGAWLSGGQIGAMTVVIVIVTGPLIARALRVGRRWVGGRATQ